MLLHRVVLDHRISWAVSVGDYSATRRRLERDETAQCSVVLCCTWLGRKRSRPSLFFSLFFSFSLSLFARVCLCVCTVRALDREKKNLLPSTIVGYCSVWCCWVTKESGWVNGQPFHSRFRFRLVPFFFLLFFHTVRHFPWNRFPILLLLPLNPSNSLSLPPAACVRGTYCLSCGLCHSPIERSLPHFETFV